MSGQEPESAAVQKATETPEPLWLKLAKWAVPAVVLPAIVWAFSVHGTAINKQRDISDNKASIAKFREEIGKVRDSFDSQISKIREELKRGDERDNLNRREVEKALSDLRVILAEVRGQYASMEGSFDDLLQALRERRRHHPPR